MIHSVSRLPDLNIGQHYAFLRIARDPASNLRATEGSHHPSRFLDRPSPDRIAGQISLLGPGHSSLLARIQNGRISRPVSAGEKSCIPTRILRSLFTSPAPPKAKSWPPARARSRVEIPMVAAIAPPGIPPVSILGNVNPSSPSCPASLRHERFPVLLQWRTGPLRHFLPARVLSSGGDVAGNSPLHSYLPYVSP
jgi:hypothetical protein